MNIILSEDIINEMLLLLNNVKISDIIRDYIWICDLENISNIKNYILLEHGIDTIYNDKFQNLCNSLLKEYIEIGVAICENTDIQIEKFQYIFTTICSLLVCIYYTKYL